MNNLTHITKGDNKPHNTIRPIDFKGSSMPLNQIDLFRDEVYNLIQSANKPDLVNNNNKVDIKVNKIKRINEYDQENDFLDNNYKGNKIDIIEYILSINSANRDCKIYPNPFNYKVFFNSNDQNNAKINRIFKNVKYIKLHTISIPRRNYVSIKNFFVYSITDTYKLVDLFNNNKSNDRIILYKKYFCEINNNNDKFYFVYYKMIINNIPFYFTTYSIYFDNMLKNKSNILLNNLSNQDFINKFFNNEILDNTDFTSTQIEINNWILIDISNNNIKFCYENNDFNEIISNTFELSFDPINKKINYLKMFVLNSECCLELYRYLLLNISEFNDTNTSSTDQNIESSFAMLFNDYICGDYYNLETYYHKDFNHSTLGNINKMSINIKDMYNKDLTTSYKNIIDYDINDTPKDLCICNYDEETGEKLRNYRCRHSYLRHPGYEKLQNNLLFKIGVLEGSQNIEKI